MTIDLNPIMTHALDEGAKEVLGGGDVLRMFYAADDEGKLNMIAAPVYNEESEMAMLDYLRTMFAVWRITQYAMVSETWVSENAKYSRGENTGLRPEHDPNRKEAITCMAIRRVRAESGELLEIRKMGRRLITRNPLSVAPTEWVTSADGNLRGRMFALLPPLGLDVPPSVRDNALEVLKHPHFKHRTGMLH